jgi:hypothetical protein
MHHKVAPNCGRLFLYLTFINSLTERTLLMSGLKTCACCGEIKPTTSFYKASKSKDKLQSYCKSCATKIVVRKRAEGQLAAIYQKLHCVEDKLRELTA